jgi:hypothetical protein
MPKLWLLETRLPWLACLGWYALFKLAASRQAVVTFAQLPLLANHAYPGARLGLPVGFAFIEISLKP